MGEKPGSSAETGEASPAKARGRSLHASSGVSKTGSLFKRRRSLARRLATTYLLTTLFILVGLSAAVYFFTALYLDQRLDTELATQADFYAAYAASLTPDERALAGLAATIAGLFAPQADLTVRFFAASDGALLAATQDIGPQPSQAALRQLRYRSPTLFTQPSRDLPHRRYAARPVVVGERTIGVVEVSRSTLASERFLASLRYILLGTILVAVLASLLVSIVLARRLSHPVRDMERATRRIAAGNLDVRLGHYPPDEVGRLAQSINHMAERLKHLETTRARFISEISHDLRTPLTAIKGLLVNLIDDSGVDERPSLQIAEQETDRLIRLVNQLLDFSRWQSGRLELNRRPIDIGTIVRDAITLSEGRARHRHITLNADIPSSLPTLSADPDRLQRVMLNLLDNAIKFTPAGGSIVVRTAVVDAGQETGETGGKGDGGTRRQDARVFSSSPLPVTSSVCLLISVHDTGQGMSQEEQERAFEPYYRGQGGGAGLGLAIAQAIVEAHGGRMGIESSQNQGCRVWFTLPL